MIEDDDMRSPIDCAAIRFKEKIYSLPRPNRHQDIISHIMKELNLSYLDVDRELDFDWDYGFLDTSGRYLSRKQAAYSAFINKQIKDGSTVHHSTLTTENLW